MGRTRARAYAGRELPQAAYTKGADRAEELELVRFDGDRSSEAVGALHEHEAMVAYFDKFRQLP